MPIILANSLTVTETAETNLNNPVIGYHNLVTPAGTVADTEDELYPAVNLANPATHLFWQGADYTEQYLTFTVASADPIDYIAIARHNFGSAEYIVTVEIDTGGSPQWEEIIGDSPFTELTGDEPIIYRFTPTVVQGIRLRLQQNNSPSDPPRAAVVYVGRLLIVQRRIYVGHTPIPLGRVVNVVNGKSQSGNILGRIVVGEFVQTSVDLQNLTPSWYRANFDPFVVAGKESPFFFAWRPGTYPNEVGYGVLTNDPAPVNQRSNGMMQVSLQMDGIV